jgi:hypothetical protein
MNTILVPLFESLRFYNYTGMHSIARLQISRAVSSPFQHKCQAIRARAQISLLAQPHKDSGLPAPSNFGSVYAEKISLKLLGAL